MKTSTERILTTHTGSLPRPVGRTDRHDPVAVRAAVRETVARQREAGVDIINDGEVSKPSYATYVTERLSGFSGEPVPLAPRGFEDFPSSPSRCGATRAWRRSWPIPLRRAGRLHRPRAGRGRHRQPQSRRPRRRGRGLHDGRVARRDRDVHGQPLLPQHRGVPVHPGRGHEARIRRHPPGRPGPATGLPRPGSMGARPEQAPRSSARWWPSGWKHSTTPPGTSLRTAMRMHLCWGNYEGPHHHRRPARGHHRPGLAARPAAVSFEAANPRHEHEWTVFEHLKLPEGKALIPGVLDSTTNYIEHPELVAQRIIRYASSPARRTSSPERLRLRHLRRRRPGRPEDHLGQAGRDDRRRPAGQPAALEAARPLTQPAAV